MLDVVVDHFARGRRETMLLINLNAVLISIVAIFLFFLVERFKIGARAQG